MSFSVNGSNANNPFALWQSLLQPDSSASDSAQSDPIASLLAALGQGQGTATSATAASGGGVILDKRHGDVGQFIAAIRRANPADAVRHAGQRSPIRNPCCRSSPAAAARTAQIHRRRRSRATASTAIITIITSGSWRWLDRRANRRRAVGRLHFVGELEHSRWRQRGEQQSARAPDPDAGAIDQSDDGAERRHGLKLFRP